jgi:branched-chain amino acid transport system substrate-binding protein
MRRVVPVVSLAALAAAACIALGALPALAQTKESLKLGIPTATSGPFAVIAPEIQRALDFAVEEANAKGGVDGRKVEYRLLDTEAKPDVARRQAEKLALEGFNILTGTISSGEGLALGPMLERWDAIFVSTMSKSTKLVGDSCNARFFRANQGDAHDIAVVKPWLAGRKEKKWAVLALDNAWGRDIGKHFKEAAGGAGLQMTSEQYIPFGTNDFAPFIQQIKTGGAEAAFVALTGRDGINFLTQAKQFGLSDSTLIAGISINLDSVVRAVGPVAKGIWGNMNYSHTIDTPSNKAFVEAWKKKYNGTPPTDLEGENYVGYQAIFQAVEKAKSVKPTDVGRALSGGTFETLFGNVKIRPEDNQMVLPNYFGEVAEQDGKVGNVVKFTLSAEQATPPVDPACKIGKL